MKSVAVSFKSYIILRKVLTLKTILISKVIIWIALIALISVVTSSFWGKSGQYDNNYGYGGYPVGGGYNYGYGYGRPDYGYSGYGTFGYGGSIYSRPYQTLGNQIIDQTIN